MIRTIIHRSTASRSDPVRYNIGKKTDRSFASVLAESMVDHPISGLASNNSNYYTVKEWDSLSKIVKNFVRDSNSNVAELVNRVARDNGLSNPNFIFEGQGLDISSLKTGTHGEPSSMRKGENFSEDGIRGNSHKDNELLHLIRDTSISDGVSPYLSVAIARAESGISTNDDKTISLNPYAINPDSKCKGLFQLIGQRGQRFHEALGLGK